MAIELKIEKHLNGISSLIILQNLMKLYRMIIRNSSNSSGLLKKMAANAKNRKNM
jgi:hypothetical protein